MTDLSSPPPEWAEAAERAGTELGLGTAMSVVDADGWTRICARAGQILSGQGHVLPPGWERALARALGRAEPAVLSRDEADALLAERGEVFAPEDDA